MYPETIQTRISQQIPLLSQFINILPDMCFIISKDGIILDVNNAVFLKLGHSRDYLINQPFNFILNKSHHKEFFQTLKNCLNKQELFSFESHLLMSDGRMLDVKVYLSHFCSSEDLYLPDDTVDLYKEEKYSWCYLIARDISDEKKRELDLVRFSNIAHYTVNPIEITDINGRIIYINPAFEKVSGYTREELIGKNPNIFGSNKHPKIFWKQMWETISAGKVWVGEVENRRKNGEPFFTQLLISPIVDGAGRVLGYFGVHRDITEQRYLRHQLIHVQKMESIGLIAAGIAHEVGNPLASISSLVQVIQRTTQDEFTQEKLELIKSQINRISRILRDLVDFSRRSSFEVQLTNLNKIIKEAVEIVRVGRKAKEISFEVQLDQTIPNLPLVPDQIEQVFINILINAVDAINAKKNNAQIDQKIKFGKIYVTSSIDRDYVVIKIKDDGIGIAADAIPKVFEPFYTTKKIGEGTGLGLWVSYGIINSFGGKIEVESVLGEFTTFIIKLPMQAEY